MSRSKKGSKGPGYDYWSKRHGNASGCNSPGGKGQNSTKNITTKAERRISKNKIQKEE
jgi:hypothetical protein